MKLDKHVVDMFTELTKPADDVKMEKTCYGTISVVDGTRYVKLDGSDLLVPAASTVKTSHGDRVTVLMKNHSLTVTGNLTAPATDGEGGSSGEAGTAATIEVGTVTTGEAGSSASVTNSGTTSAAVFDFVIPRGDKGEKGEKGDTGTWDGTIPDHEHTVSDITDFPTSLPANGGNANTLESHPASHFVQTAVCTTITTSINDCLTAGSYFCNRINTPDYPIDIVESWGMLHVFVYGSICYQLLMTDGSMIAFRSIIVGQQDWTSWKRLDQCDGGNADTLDGKHASDFYQVASGLRTAASYYDIFSTTLSYSHACWNKWCYIVGNSTDSSTSDYIDNAPEALYALWYEVFTGGHFNRAFQIAFGCFSFQRKTFIRYMHDGEWSDWYNIADGGNADTLDGLHASDFISTTELAFQSICPSNVFLYDDLNSPSVMVKIPKMTWAQLGIGDSSEIFPAFIVNGQVVDALYFPKYENIVQNNRGYSLPARDPAVYVDCDQSVAYSTAKGIGWHSMTRLEWCVIALWCLQNGFQPNGNNNFGKDISESTYKAIPTLYHSDGRTQRVATGTGPLTWSHNNAPDGIYDLNGNVWEWTTGVRSVYGELQVLSHDGVTFGNDAAHPANSQAADSALWRAIDGTTGALITPDGSGTTANSLKLDFTSSGWKWVTGTISSKQNSNRYAKFESTTVDSTVCVAAQRILQALCLYKANDTVDAYKNDGFWGNNGSAETLFIAGGNWTVSARAGVFEVYCCNPRSDSGSYLGFRSAFVNLPTT